MREVIRLYMHLFERGASVRDVLEDEDIKLRYESTPADVGGWSFPEQPRVIFVSARLSNASIDRVLVHELGHLKGLSERKCKILAELYLTFYSRPLPPLDVLLLVAAGIGTLIT